MRGQDQTFDCPLGKFGQSDSCQAAKATLFAKPRETLATSHAYPYNPGEWKIACKKARKNLQGSRLRGELRADRLDFPTRTLSEVATRLLTLPSGCSRVDELKLDQESVNSRTTRFYPALRLLLLSVLNGHRRVPPLFGSVLLP